MKLKSLFTLSLLLISFTTLMSQSPGRINYQGVVRNSDSSPVTNQNVTFRFSLLDAVDNIVYSEIQSLSTNEYGIVICTIGEGNPALFSSVNWSAGEYSLKVECDPAGGTNYSITDTKPISSVPYALYGRDEDADPANEIQSLSISSDQLSISGGNSVPLTSYKSPWSSSGSSLYYSSGNVGLFNSSPYYRLDVNGEIASRNTNAFRLRQATYSSIIRNDNSNFYLLLTAGGDPDGTWNTLRPFMVNLATGNIGMGNNALYVQHGGNIGVGTVSPTAKMAVQPPSTWSDEVPLFEVKNKYGDPVFSVYNNGVRINIEDADAKGPRGGFAIGGFDRSKGEATVDFMRISPDSIRFNINNDPDAKGPRGGFAIGGFDRSKGPVNEDFMYITPTASADGSFNTFMGYHAGLATLGTFPDASFNTFIGYESGLTNKTGIGNLFLGYSSGRNNTIGDYNTFVGPASGLNNIDGNYNTFLGMGAGQNLTHGSKNILIGWMCGAYQSNYITGDNNIAMGTTFYYNTSGSNNIFLGNSAGIMNSTGEYNTMVGNSSGRMNGTGARNSYLGYAAGDKNNGSNNVFIGYRAGYLPTAETYKLVIEGNGGNYGTISNGLICGDFLARTVTFNGKVGIGTTAPVTKLAIVGLTGTTSGSYLRVYNDNIYYYSSSRDTKENIMPLEEDFYKILNAEPVSFTDKVSGEENIGFIAETFDEIGLQNLVIYENGKAKSISYELVALYNLEIIKEQQQIIEMQEKRMSALEDELAEIKKMVGRQKEKDKR